MTEKKLDETEIKRVYKTALSEYFLKKITYAIIGGAALGGVVVLTAGLNLLFPLSTTPSSIHQVDFFIGVGGGAVLGLLYSFVLE